MSLENENKGYSRRDFVKGTTAGLFMLGAAVTLGGCAGGQDTPQSAAASDQPVETSNWDYEADVICCGYGASGTSAAIEASDAGCSVILLEKADKPGGSMARCGGGMSGAGTKVQKELGIDDSAEKFYGWVKTCVGDLCPDDIIRTYAEHSAGNIDWLNELNNQYKGEDLFVAEIATGYFNGVNASGCDYAEFGLSEEDAIQRSHWAWVGTGSDAADINAAGPELFDPLYLAVQDRADSISVMFETALSRLIKNDAGEIIGVTALQSGNEIRIKAKKGVVLGTGGFPYNDEMKAVFQPEALNYLSYMSPNCVGDGIKAAMEVGAGLYNMTQYYPLEAVYPVYAGTSQDEVVLPNQYKAEWDDVFQIWNHPEDIPGRLNIYGSTMAEMHGGLVINTKAEVQDVFGKTIPRLYASGCDTGTNVFGAPHHYPGCGTYVGFSVAFGRIAGQSVAELSSWDEA